MNVSSGIFKYLFVICSVLNINFCAILLGFLDYWRAGLQVHSLHSLRGSWLVKVCKAHPSLSEDGLDFFNCNLSFRWWCLLASCSCYFLWFFCWKLAKLKPASMVVLNRLFEFNQLITILMAVSNSNVRVANVVFYLGLNVSLFILVSALCKLLLKFFNSIHDNGVLDFNARLFEDVLVMPDMLCLFI